MRALRTSHRAADGTGNFLQGAVVCLLALALSACSAPGPKAEAGRGQPETTASPTGAGAAEAGPGAPSEEADPGDFSRNANLTAGLVGSLVKTYTTDPFVRPLSSVKALGFLVTNSVSDLTRRMYINTVELPAVKATPIPPLATHSGMDLAEWERELERITGSKSSSGTLEFLIDGDQFFPALVEQIEAAQQSVQLRTYIFDNDDVAVRIADLLKERSEHVDVTVLMDGIGSVTGANVVSASLPGSHVPPGSIARYLQTDSKVKARELTNPWFTGDHCKVAIIDRKVAFLGGMNIGREYRYDWHDLMVRVEGSVVEELARDADEAWEQSGLWGDLAALFRKQDPAERFDSGNGYPVRVLHTRAGNSQIYEAKIAAIQRARQYIYIENPYFSDDVILFELIKARRRGVDVRFIISNGGDHPLMDLSNAKVISEMLDNGIRVFVYPKMTHAKAAIIDGWLTVGSANLDNLSLRLNKEVNVATSHPQAVQALKENLFERDFEASTELLQPLPTQLTHWLAEMFADVFM